MRIQKLDENSRKNLLEDLLKRSPNNYGQYEQGVGIAIYQNCFRHKGTFLVG